MWRNLKGGGGYALKQQEKNFELEYRQKHKKCKGTMLFKIIAFFGNKVSYFKNDLAQKTFLKDLSFYIVKGYHLLSLVKNPWLK
jgi:hypothetical protein